jgi:hypothetical protein
MGGASTVRRRSFMVQPVLLNAHQSNRVRLAVDLREREAQELNAP